MLIEILRQTSIAGDAVRPGDVVDCNEQDARYLVTARKARLAGSQSLPAASMADMEDELELTVEERKPTVRRPKTKKPITTPED